MTKAPPGYLTIIIAGASSVLALISLMLTIANRSADLRVSLEQEIKDTAQQLRKEMNDTQMDHEQRLSRIEGRLGTRGQNEN